MNSRTPQGVDCIGGPSFCKLEDAMKYIAYFKKTFVNKFCDFCRIKSQAENYYLLFFKIIYIEFRLSILLLIVYDAI